MKRIDVRLSTADAAKLKLILEETGLKPTDFIRESIRKFPQNSGKMPQNSGKMPQKPRGRRSIKEKNIERTPLVSPQGDLFLSSFSSLFSNKTEFKCPEFELAWKRFVEMRSDPQTKPPPVSARAAEVFAEKFAKFDLQPILDALAESVMSEWSGVFPKEKPPPDDEEDSPHWDLPKPLCDRR